MSAKIILENENKLLRLLSGSIREFAKDYSGFERDNLECWAKELDGYRAINDEYIAMEEPKRKAALNEEAQILEGARDCIKDGSSSNYWRNYLDENIWYTRELAKL